MSDAYEKLISVINELEVERGVLIELIRVRRSAFSSGSEVSVEAVVLRDFNVRIEDDS